MHQGSAPLRGLVKILLDLPVGEVRCRAIVRRVIEHHGVAAQIVAMDPTDRARLYEQDRSLLA